MHQTSPKIAAQNEKISADQVQKQSGDQLKMESKEEFAKRFDEHAKYALKQEQKKNQTFQRQCDQTSQTSNAKSQIKIFRKAPSYFLEIQEEQILVEQRQSLEQSSKYQMSKSAAQHKKMMSKLESKCTTFNLLKQKQLSYNGQVFLFLNHNQFKAKKASICSQQLTIGDFVIDFSQITKVKCLLQSISSTQLEKKIKIVKNCDTEYYLAATPDVKDEENSKFTQHFIWFSKIVYNKVQSIKNELKFTKYEQLSQIFLQNSTIKSIMEKNPQIKIQLEQKLPVSSLEYLLCEGKILKKSRFLKSWQTRHIVITEQQLFSFRNVHENYTFSIKSADIKYIWTRFQLHNGYLIVKIKHGMIQTEFGIPIVNYCKSGSNNWLWAFYRLMLWNKYHHQTE